MQYLLILTTALAISLAVVPLMVAVAPRLGMMDMPDERKVHAIPVPRVGGWGIVLGAVAAVLLWGPVSPLVASYVAGSLILLLFGAWDDRHDLSPYAKFLGQAVAVFIVVVYGGVSITSFPFLDGQVLPPSVAMLFTGFALMGVINALNTADGLDGLAGGLSLLSLAAILFLSHLGGSNSALVIACAAAGGIFGFLRYNTHPANVFMGDGGSQFLGFTVGILAVLLTQRVDPLLSPAVVMLLLGLPVVDIVVVILRRTAKGLHWFKASKDHLHHRLMDLGFSHKRSVVVIYLTQAIFALLAIYLGHRQDWLVALAYLSVCLLVYMPVQLAELSGWHRGRDPEDLVNGEPRRAKQVHAVVVWMPRRFLEIMIPIALLLASVGVEEVPRDFGMIAVVLFGLMLLQLVLPGRRTLTRRGSIYTTAAFVVYLFVYYRPQLAPWAQQIHLVFYILVVAGIWTALRYSPGRREQEFRTTTMDYLLMLVVMSALFLLHSPLNTNSIGAFLVQLVIILYACELLIVERRQHWNWLGPASLATVGIIAVRGLL